MTISENEIVTRNENVVAREVGGETVLLDLEAGTYFGLNAVGGAIWTALEDGPRTLADLCSLVASTFDAPDDVIESDIKALISDLQANGLVA
ncbi:PqqD family protein [Aurantiacibacter marinus]|uniref:Thymidylate synthase n=1 Tax=Aurantiacibacter marinus TaxID=874156 RepID=A0A0H0XPS3_9SPHN|nr:PqqD family protein [Aurantiacibacter marinus]KLI64623.1 hypothetical protein AAV99_03450 [Aurantiacibacter marinus]